MIAKRVAILQSNYIPWRGYFDILGGVDEFIIYDVVQFTKNDWRNRNRIRTANGVQWLTIPVKTSGRFGQTIAETEVDGTAWAESHWKSISQAYARAPFFARYREPMEQAYARCAGMPRLSDVNRSLIVLAAGLLGFTTRISDASQHVLEGDRNERLVGMCRASGATTYVSGPSAAEYLDVPMFAAAGVDVHFMDYSGYAPYPQVHGGFEPQVSILDLLFNTGDRASSYMTSDMSS